MGGFKLIVEIIGYIEVQISIKVEIPEGGTDAPAAVPYTRMRCNVCEGAVAHCSETVGFLPKFVR